MAVYNVGQRRLNTICKKLQSGDEVIKENRGGDTRTSKFLEKLNAVKSFISQLQGNESHYGRNKSRRIYVSSEYNISVLWQLYNKNSPDSLKVNYKYFSRVFNKYFNIGFGSPATDICSYCVRTQTKIGMKQVGCLSSAERGQLVTAEICFNAAGTYVPPMLIYPRKRMKDELLDDAPPGFWGTCSDNGWITLKIFFDWFKSFVRFTGATKEKPVLLILDGHASHTKNIEVIDYAREHHVILLCTPPHCTHKLQPADVTFNGPLSTYYSAASPGRVVTPYQVAKLFGNAYLKAATMLTAINGFKTCGIWPVDRNVFTEADFIAAETTNTERIVYSGDLNATTTNDTSNHTEVSSQPGSPTSAILVSPLAANTYIIDESVASTSQTKSQPSAPTSSISLSINSECGVFSKTSEKEHLYNPIVSPETVLVDQQRSPLSLFIEEREKTPEKQMANSSFLVSPADIIAVPKEIRTQERKTRKRGKIAVLTDSPYKNELKRELETKIKKKKTGEQKTEKNKPNYKTNEKKCKKKEPEEKSNAKKPKKNKVQMTKKEIETDTDSSQEDDDDCACIYCGYLYSQSVEGWVMCSVCHGWAHNSCAGVDDEDDEAHTCERCQPD
nr:unnamed protein product [Callosobruchus chinensis]